MGSNFTAMNVFKNFVNFALHFRYTFTVIASVLVYVITWATFHLSSGDEEIGPQDVHSFQVLDFISLRLPLLLTLFVRLTGSVLLSRLSWQLA